MGDYIPTEPLVEAQAAAMTRGGFSRDIWILMALAVQITFLRTYSRWRMVGWRKFQADDVLVWLALVSAPIHLISLVLASLQQSRI